MNAINSSNSLTALAAITGSKELVVRHLGLLDYAPVWQAMQQFTVQRNANTADEIWMLEHTPVFTLGQAGKLEHLLQTSNIPIIPIDRGGQITYHGPGQIVAYLLIDLKRRGYGVSAMVKRMEQAIIDMLQTYGITAHRLHSAPGVYVNNAKIAALGLRIKRGCSYHGLALNVDMDLTPFSHINPCGYANMPVTQMRDLAVGATIEPIRTALAAQLIHHLTLANSI